MEAHDLFADHVHIRRPVAIELRVVFLAITERRNVIAEGIQPYVNHVLRITRNRYAPFKRAATDGEIAQAATHKRNHLVATRFRADKIRVFGVELQQLVFKGRELEEVVFFADRLSGTTAFRTWGSWRSLHEHFVVNAILSGV